MQVLSGPGYEEVVKVVECRWDTRLLLLHYRDQVLCDFLHFILSKETRNLHTEKHSFQFDFRASFVTAGLLQRFHVQMTYSHLS